MTVFQALKIELKTWYYCYCICSS